MLVHCWGARGSIPVSGREYLRYGGDTPCIEIRTGDDRIVIVDAGSGIRRLGNRLIAEKRHDFALIFTHAHWDHIMGFPFFRPIYRSGTRIWLAGASAAVRRVLVDHDVDDTHVAWAVDVSEALAAEQATGR